MPVEFKDYYATLGVPRNASEDDIKKAFRRLARRHHPDVARDKQAAEAKFKEINEAHAVLSDPVRRHKYDALGTGWDRGPSFGPQGKNARSWSSPDGARGFEFHFGGTGFSDFFEQLFGRGGRFADFESGFDRRHASYEDGEDSGDEGRHRGADFEGEILVTLNEARHGSVRSLSLRRSRPDGEVETHSFKVRIPAGIEDGATIRVPGQGGHGHSGGPPGDVRLRVRLEAHPDFRPQGADLYHDLDLAPWDAVLGTTVKVPTLDGSVTVRVPPGTNSGQQLRVRGHGLPRRGGAKQGDLYVVVNVRLPQSVSEEARALWEQLRQSSRFDPRSNP